MYSDSQVLLRVCHKMFALSHHNAAGDSKDVGKLPVTWG